MITRDTSWDLDQIAIGTVPLVPHCVLMSGIVSAPAANSVQVIPPDHDKQLIRIARSSLLVGAASGLMLAAFYAGVLTLLGGAEHVAQQWSSDALWVLALSVAFGVQASLMAELRTRRRLDIRNGTTVGAAGGASAVGMVACCAHHAADLAPLLGASGAAAALAAYRTPMMVMAISLSLLGIGIALRRLRSSATTLRRAEVGS